MAITFKEMSAWTILEKLGFYPDVCEKLKGLGYSVKLGTGGLFLTVTGGFVVASVPISPSKLSLLKQGTLAEGTKALIANQIIAALKKHAPKDFGQWVITPELEQASKPKSILDIVPPINKDPEPPAEPAPTVQAWAEFPEAQKKTASPVKLRDATMMYQPVRGTSNSSRYYVVGANKDLRIAARLQGDALSVRAEGPGWGKYKGALSLAGFQKVEDANQYASLHLNVGPNAVMAAKTLGAVLMGLGVKLETPLPELSKLPKG